jgi:hypothetical protein
MTPANMTLTLYKGDSYQWQFILWTDETKTSPIDLSGVTAKSEIRDKPGGVLLSSMVCTVELPNIIMVNLNADESSKLTTTKAAWDLQLTYADGRVATIAAGPVKVTIDVTVLP